MAAVPAGQLVKSKRSDNRYEALLQAAAHLFRARGFKATSMREIARACEMLPGSVYYHFASKDDLLAAVHEEGIRQITESVMSAIAPVADPWTRLRVAARAHMNAILDQSDYAAVVIRGMPPEDGPLRRRLAALREDYERIFRGLVDDLPLGEGRDTVARRKYLRLALLGALNWSQSWYRPGGDDPATVADEIVSLFGCGEKA